MTTGRVVHFEIPVEDEERAFRFYAQAFGWHVQAVPGLAYTLVSTGPMGDSGEPLQKLMYISSSAIHLRLHFGTASLLVGALSEAFVWQQMQQLAGAKQEVASC